MATITAKLKGGAALKHHLAHISKALGTDVHVDVGFLGSATYPAQLAADKKNKTKVRGKNVARRLAKAAASNLDVAQVAFWNEFGTSRAPARPFIRNMVASKSPRWGIALGASLRQADYDSEKALGVMGEVIKDEMVKSIVDFKAPPNAPYTVAQKGFDKPLIDTGVMQRSVDFQVIGFGEG